jgi:sulfur-oxidizing protein SoxY
MACIPLVLALCRASSRGQQEIAVENPPEDPQDLQLAADLATLLALPARLRTVRALLDGERGFDELRVRADVPAPELLAHLNLMCQHGVLVWRHAPRQVLYGLAPRALRMLARGLSSRFGPMPLTPILTRRVSKMQNRRDMLAQSAAVLGLMAGAGLLPSQAQAAWSTSAFEAKNLADAMKALGLAMPVESKEVTLSASDIAENGAVVPLVVSCSAPGVKRLMVLVEKNPAALAAVFDLGEGVETMVNTRVKMGQTSKEIGRAHV